MNKIVLAGAAAGLVSMLASCGGLGSSAPTTGVKLQDFRTEYVDQATGNFVACDNVISGGTSTTKTAVAVSFAIAGTPTSLTVGLRGVTSSQYDSNYTAQFNQSQIGAASSTGAYRVTFYADASSGFLPQSVRPQSIAVTPVPATTYIKRVSTSGFQGQFYGAVTATNEFGPSSDSTQNYSSSNRQIPVYSSCTVTATTTDLF